MTDQVDFPHIAASVCGVKNHLEKEGLSICDVFAIFAFLYLTDNKICVN